MTDSSPIERELQIRLAAMAWLSSQRADLTFPHDQLTRFEFQGQRIPLNDRQRGIRKPASMTAALSFRTVYTPPDQAPPYADQEGPDGLLRYKMRGDDPFQAENVALRRAMERQLPLIWFVGVSPGVYLARFPVYLIAEEPAQLQFTVALDDMQRRLHDNTEVITEDDRRYAEGITRRRLHQPLFRARVLEAYTRRCAMCRLGHVALLDASHILGDKHALGQPIVPNGFALCKIHHAAFDANIIGVRPDLTIAIRRDILDEVDGPMLKHGLQELNGERITVPTTRAARPTAERLEIRYELFKAA